mgnify:FL=1|jgi:hypothetical protein
MASHPIEQLSTTYLGKNSSELEPEELRVLNSLHSQTPLARDAADLSDDVSTYGERLPCQISNAPTSKFWKSRPYPGGTPRYW